VRILIVHNEYRLRGGEESVVRSEAELLTAQGHSVKLLLRGSSEIDDFSISEKVKLLADLAWSSRSFNTIQSAVRDFKADIVHAHNIHPLWSPSIFAAAHAAGAATVLTLHNFRLVCMNGGLLIRNGRSCGECLESGPWRGILHRCGQGSLVGSLAMARMMRVNRRRGTWSNDVDAFIALTTDSKETFIRGGVPPDHIYVKPNFVMDPLQDRTIENSRHGALFIGHLLAFKGVEMLIEAWQGIDYPLCIVGEGPLIDSLRARAPRSVTFAGSMSYPAVLELLTRSSFVVFPSLAREGFPRVIIEAFATGRAVVASRHGAMKEIVRHNETGLLYEPGSIEDLRRQTELLVSKPELALRLGRSGRREYLTKFTSDLNYQHLMNVYEHARNRYGRARAGKA
jgi:glycosyltransferase involved in cell wall biosynthesis